MVLFQGIEEDEQRVGRGPHRGDTDIRSRRSWGWNTEPERVGVGPWRRDLRLHHGGRNEREDVDRAAETRRGNKEKGSG